MKRTFNWIVGVVLFLGLGGCVAAYTLVDEAEAGCAISANSGSPRCGPGDCAVSRNSGSVYCSKHIGGGAAVSANSGSVLCGVGGCAVSLNSGSVMCSPVAGGSAMVSPNSGSVRCTDAVGNSVSCTSGSSSDCESGR